MVSLSPAVRDEEMPYDLAAETAIRKITARIVDIPTTRHHRLSNTSVRHQSYVHVAVQFENGVTGHGEAATLGGPRWAEESVEAISANIDAYLAPALIGRPGAAIHAADIAMNRAAKRNNAAKSAINAALLDATGLTFGLPASQLLGGAVRDRFDVIWALASGDAGQEAEEAREKIEKRQFNRFKIKLGFGDAKADIHRLTHLRASLPESTQIIADINQGWSEAEATRWLPALADLQISLIEQPLPAAQLAAMARVAARSDVPVMLDEAVFSTADALMAAQHGAGSVLSLKLCKHGSAHTLQAVAAVGSAAGMQLYGGCLLESSLGAAAHLAVFATLPTLEWGTEHFGPKILTQDSVTEPLEFKDFQVILPKGPGLGVRPDPDRIAAFARKDQTP